MVQLKSTEGGKIMLNRFVSHVLIGMATFVLCATFFMWTLDSRVFNAEVLNGELRKAGVGSEFASLMPEVITAEESATDLEKATMKDNIARSVDAFYVEGKLTGISESLLAFMKGSANEPLIDLSDFPDRLAANGIEVDEEMRSEFAKPIKLNEDGNLNVVPDTYRAFRAAKFAGLAVFGGLLLIEWLVSEKGKKLRRISRIFLYAGVSYLIYWLLLRLAPSRLGPVLENNVQAEYDVSALINAILEALNGLFSAYFLSFALACFAVAAVLYAIRHFKDGDVLQNESFEQPKLDVPKEAPQQ
jgi:hypothetical protein